MNPTEQFQFELDLALADSGPFIEDTWISLSDGQNATPNMHNLESLVDKSFPYSFDGFTFNSFASMSSNERVYHASQPTNVSDVLSNIPSNPIDLGIDLDFAPWLSLDGAPEPSIQQ
ncbi:hypothetical protein N0V90_002979 [Kalmusia sp. IMI 367209]|nr:hypothetical protein N0V90_002979 [Kalmusia sp. IMI 367209]